MVMVSAVCFSAKAVFAKLAYRYGADAGTVLALRMAFALPFFVGANLLAARRLRARPLARRERALLFALGSAGYYLASYFDFLGLQYVSAGVERLILFLYPTLVVLMNAAFHGERVGRRTVGALVLSYAGVGLVVWGDRPASGPGLALGCGLVFLGALAYAFYLSFSQPLIARHGSSRVTGQVLIVACLCAIAHFAAGAKFERLRQPWQVIALCAATGVVATVLPAFLLTAGIERLGASRASVIGTLGPVATLLLAHWVLDEPLTALQGVGAALVIVATLGGNVRSARPGERGRRPNRAGGGRRRLPSGRPLTKVGPWPTKRATPCCGSSRRPGSSPATTSRTSAPKSACGAPPRTGRTCGGATTGSGAPTGPSTRATIWARRASRG